MIRALAARAQFCSEIAPSLENLWSYSHLFTILIIVKMFYLSNLNNSHFSR